MIAKPNNVQPASHTAENIFRSRRQQQQSCKTNESVGFCQNLHLKYVSKCDGFSWSKKPYHQRSKMNTSRPNQFECIPIEVSRIQLVNIAWLTPNNRYTSDSAWSFALIDFAPITAINWHLKSFKFIKESKCQTLWNSIKIKNKVKFSIWTSYKWCRRMWSSFQWFPSNPFRRKCFASSYFKLFDRIMQ